MRAYKDTKQCITSNKHRHWWKYEWYFHSWNQDDNKETDQEYTLWWWHSTRIKSTINNNVISKYEWPGIKQDILYTTWNMHGKHLLLSFLLFRPLIILYNHRPIPFLSSPLSMILGFILAIVMMAISPGWQWFFNLVFIFDIMIWLLFQWVYTIFPSVLRPL